MGGLMWMGGWVDTAAQLTVINVADRLQVLVQGNLRTGHVHLVLLIRRVFPQCRTAFGAEHLSTLHFRYGPQRGTGRRLFGATQSLEIRRFDFGAARRRVRRRLWRLRLLMLRRRRRLLTIETLHLESSRSEPCEPLGRGRLARVLNDRGHADGFADLKAVLAGQLDHPCRGARIASPPRGFQQIRCSA